MQHGADIAQVLGGLGMFLLGMHTLTTALRAIAGDALARALRRSTHSPVSGALLGTITTALIQSSSATTVAAVGFVSAGILSFGQAIGIILGANVGTTITGWIVAVFGFKFDIVALALPLVLVGMVIKLVRSKQGAGFGLTLAGLGLIFVGIGNMQEGFDFIHTVLDPSSFSEPGVLGSLLMVGVGFVATAVSQSSSAGVALALTGVHSGAIPVEHAALAVIGMDLGSSATALIASLGTGTSGRRTGVAHFAFNLFTAVLAMALLHPYLWIVGEATVAAEPELVLVGFHTAFNVLATLVGLPLVRPFARLIERLVPAAGSSMVADLDPRLASAPELAIEVARVAALRLAQQLLDTVARVLRGEPAAPSPTLEADLEALREYLDSFVTRPGDIDSHAHHRDLMHAADHLTRLEVRLRLNRVPGPNDSAWGPAIAAAGQHLASEDPAELGSRYRALIEQDGRLRDELMARVAKGELEGKQALTHIRAGRNLYRAVNHAYRAMLHLVDSGRTNGERALAAADADD